MPRVMRRFKPDQLVVCFESFASTDPLGGCGQGTRLRGSHPIVKKWPQFFAPADTPDDELIALRRQHAEDAGVHDVQPHDSAPYRA